jgi:PAS domain S-box-containing protein
VVTWNSGAELMKGYTATEVLGKPFSLFYTEEDQAATEPVRQLLEAVDGPVEREGWRVRKSGERFWAIVVLTPLRGSSGELIGFARVTRDMTARQHAEEQRSKVLRLGERAELRDAMSSDELSRKLKR